MAVTKKLLKKFLKDLDISYLHVFTYSERANTTAKKMENVVPVNIRRERSRQLQILSEKKKRQFYETQLNKEKLVLFEAEENEHPGFPRVDIPSENGVPRLSLLQAEWIADHQDEARTGRPSRL